MKPTKPMEDATDVQEMASAFHPSAINGQSFHGNPTLDAIEAALLYGAGRISKSDFLAAIEDLP